MGLDDGEVVEWGAVLGFRNGWRGIGMGVRKMRGEGMREKGE